MKLQQLFEKEEMCPKACCGKPVSKCKCGPECPHCDCFEKNKKQVNESAEKGRKIKTDTGSARLYSDGSMKVYNSGFRQDLTPEMVQAAWSGKKVLPHHPKKLAQMKKEQLTAKEIRDSRPKYDSQYGDWDFGDELHEIPSKHDFRDKRFDRGYKMTNESQEINKEMIGRRVKIKSDALGAKAGKTGEITDISSQRDTTGDRKTEKVVVVTYKDGQHERRRLKDIVFLN